MTAELENEKARIDLLLKKGQITAEDHQNLFAALEQRQPGLLRALRFLTNPFERLPMLFALVVGVLAVVVMGVLGARYGFHYGGAITFQVISDGKPIFSFAQLVLQNGINVTCVITVFYLGALLAKCQNLRLIDFIGSVALSRVPYAFLAVALASLEGLFPNFLPRNLAAREPMAVLVLALTAISFLVWQIMLTFTALKVSSGLNGTKLRVVFLVGLVLAEVLSQLLNSIAVL